MKFSVNLFSQILRRSLRKEVGNLISRCKSLGLPEKDCIEASSFLEYNEFGLAFETILTQMYECNILIELELYRKIQAIAGRMSLKSQQYEFMSELIRPAK